MERVADTATSQHLTRTVSADNAITNLNLTDMETCYKAFRRELVQSIELREEHFGFEPKVTAKIAARRCRMYEVGISYTGRTSDDGKMA